MATIEPYQTSQGKRYRVRYRTPERKQTDKRGFKTKRDAEAFASTVEVSKLKGEYIEVQAGRATIAELGAQWLGRQTHLKPSSFRPVEAALRNHVLPTWAAHSVSEVRKTAVQQWIADMTTGGGERKPKSATVVIRAYGVLAAILDDAVEDRRITSNPARGVDLPRKGRKPHIYLSHEKVHSLAAEAKHGTLVLVLAYCGLRWGEAVALRVRHLDMLKRRISVEENAVEVGGRVTVGTPKNHKRRTVPFPGSWPSIWRSSARAKRGMTLCSQARMEAATCGQPAFRQIVGAGLPALCAALVCPASRLTICGTRRQASQFRQARMSKPSSGCSATAPQR